MSKPELDAPLNGFHRTDRSLLRHLAADERLSSAEVKLLLFALSLEREPGDGIKLGKYGVSHALGISVRTAERARRRLVEMGYLRETGTGNRGTSVFVIDDCDIHDGRHPCRPSEATAVMHDGSTAVTGDGRASTIHLLETIDTSEVAQNEHLPWSTLNSGLGGGLRPGTFNLLVGEPGSAKTYIGLAACLHAERNGWRWAYWPFERDDTYAARRLLGILTDSWTVLDSETAGEAVKLMNDSANFDIMAKMTPSIQANPRQMRVDNDGEIYVPRCDYRGILNCLCTLCESRDLVVLDPLSMLSFDDDGADAWKGQEVFAKDAAAIAAQTQSRLLVIHHTRKAAPGGKPRQSGLDEVAGSAALSRFADNLIFLEHSPDEIESEVIPPGGVKTLQIHKRTLFIAKARDGKGTGWRIACDLGQRGPVLVEHGFIRRKAR